MGKQKHKKQRSAQYRQEMKKRARCRYEGEETILAFKAHPERMMTHSRLKEKSMSYWQSDFDRWLNKHKK